MAITRRRRRRRPPLAGETEEKMGKLQRRGEERRPDGRDFVLTLSPRPFPFTNYSLRSMTDDLIS